VHVLMISDVYFPRVNGVSTSIQTFSRELQSLGHRVTLIAPDYGQGDEGDAHPFERLHRVPSRFLILDPEDRMMRRADLFDRERELRSQGIDLIHIQTPFVAHYAGLGLARRLGVPRIATYHTFFEEYLFHYVRFLPRSWMRWAARRFSAAQCNDLDAIVVPSSAMRETLERYGVRTPMRIIPTGIDHSRFQGGDGRRFRQAHGISPERPVIVHVGRIAHEKNIVFLLEVMTEVHLRMPEAVMVIAGEGPALETLKRQVAARGLSASVLFVGYLERSGALLDCYRAGDVFVFSSRTETQGLVLLEAMALGVPVVSTAVMGTRDVLVEGQGALIAGERIDDFAEKVLRVLREPDLKKTLSAKARTYAASWSSPAQASKLLELYAGVAGTSPAAALVSAVAGESPPRA
jgi:glycosyltransferase involved in cell wall biosynthesis